MNKKRPVFSFLILAFLSLHTTTLPEVSSVDPNSTTEEFVGWTVLRTVTTPFLQWADYVANEAVKADPEAGKHYNKSLERLDDSIKEGQGETTEHYKRTKKEFNRQFDDWHIRTGIPNPRKSRTGEEPLKLFEDRVAAAQRDLNEWGKKLEPVEAELEQLSSSIETLRGASKPFIYFHNTMNVGSLFVGAYIGSKVWSRYVSPLFKTGNESREAELLNKIAKVELHLAKLQSQLSSITAETSSDTTKIKEAIVKLETLLQKYQQQLVTLNNSLSPSQSKSSKTRDILSAVTRLSVMSGSALLSQAVLYQALFCSLVPPARELSAQEKIKFEQLQSRQRAIQKKHDEYLKKYKEANRVCSDFKYQPKPPIEPNSSISFADVEHHDYLVRGLNDTERAIKQNEKHIKYNLEDKEELEKNKDFEKKMIVDAIGRGISR